MRDYVHVLDLAQAHVLAMEAMLSGKARGEAFNLGNGEGFSVLQVVEAVGRVTGRNAADPASLRAGPAIRRRWWPRPTGSGGTWVGDPSIRNWTGSSQNRLELAPQPPPRLWRSSNG